MLISVVVLLFSVVASEDALNLSPYEYPRPEPESSDTYTVAIFKTNDIHGYALPRPFTDSRTGEKYYNGSIEYMSTYIDIVRNEWKDRFIWVDGGDSSFGGYEFLLSEGRIITDFFNFKNLTATTLGNHEFNKGLDFLTKLMKNSKFDFLVSNIQDKKTKKKVFLPNQLESKIYPVGKVKIGLIGMTHIKIPLENKKISSIDFLPYKKEILEQSAKLKSQGADAVFLVSHFGPICDNEDGFLDKYTLKIWTEKDRQPKCKNYEGLVDLLESLPKGTIQGLLNGHVHRISHHWINGMPVTSTTGGSYINIVYVTFKKAKGKFIFDHVSVEGPVPVCSKIFSKAKHCEYILDFDPVSSQIGKLTDFTFHGVQMKPDKELGKVIQRWKDEIAPLQEPICLNEIEMERCADCENTLQNIISDVFRKVANADISLVHVAGLRTKWFPGELTDIDMYNMFPFDNIICSVTMTGREILKMLQDSVGKASFHFTSGLAVNYSRNPNKFVSAMLFDGKKYQVIDLNKNYKFATFDYLLRGNVEFGKVMKWYKPRDMQCYTTARKAVGDFLKSVSVIKAGSFVDPLHPRIKFVN